MHKHGFLSKCENHLILPTDQSKSPENKKNIELELYIRDVVMNVILWYDVESDNAFIKR